MMETTKKTGIDNIKIAITFALSFAESIQKSLDDDKITFWEGLSIIPELKKIADIIPLIPEIKKEIADLSEEEISELNDYFVDEFKIPNWDVERKIELSLSFVVSAYNLIHSFKKDKS